MASCELRRIVWIGGVAGAYYLEVPRIGGRRVFALQIAPQGAGPLQKQFEYGNYNRLDAISASFERSPLESVTVAAISIPLNLLMT